MRGSRRIALASVLAVCALGALTVGQASGALMKAGASNLLAIYGFPAVQNEVERPVGGGLGRNFGLGENMVFQAGNGVGTVLKITLLGKVAEAQETIISGTLMSNRTGEGNAQSLTIQNVDFQDSTIGGENVSTYSDTSDRPWISEICALNEGKKECRIDPLLTEVAAAGRTVKIEDASFVLKNAVIGNVVVQGTVWGKWVNGAAKVAPCITLEVPPAGAGANQTLTATQGSAFAYITAISGQACLIAANNDWYTVGAKSEPAITIKNE